MASLHGLQVDHRSDPIGLDTERPEFSWRIEAAAGQSTYQVQVATDPGFDPATILWDSGVVSDFRPFGASYAGPSLASRTSYAWRVRAELGDTTTTPWATGTFETGTLADEEWRAEWITHPSDRAEDRRTLYFHRTYDLPAPVVRARAYASALGWYRLFVNGSDLTGPALVPRWTPFHDYTEYQVYDVTAAFTTGENTVGMVVAEGRYRGHLGVNNKPARYGDQLAAFLEIDLELADGSRASLQTDGTWQVGHGRITTADPMNGERVDLRLPELPWAAAAPAAAQPVATITAGRRLVAEETERVTQIGTRPGTISRTPSGAQLVDFGQNFSGTARIRLDGPAGETVKLLYGEVLTADGELSTDYLDLPLRKRGCFQRDEVVLSGEPTTYTSWFTIHGFRYLAVEGSVQALTTDDVEGLVLSSDLPQISDFSASDPRLEQLWSNVVWSLRSNFTDTPTDCPTRERSGWTGDIQVFSPTACQLVDADSYLRRYLRNVAAEQYDDGRVPPVIPAEDAPGRKQNNLRLTSTSVGWGDVTVLLPWTLYRYYGDVEVLRTQYDSARAWVDQLARRAATKRGWRRRFRAGVGDLETFVLDTGYQWGEWLRPGETLLSEALGNLTGGRAGVATAYLAHSARILAQIGEVIGRADDADRYRALADNAARAYRAAFVADGGSRIGDDKQDDYVRALAFDLLEPGQRAAAAGRLVELVERAGDHLGTGFLSTPMLLATLVDTGHADVAFRVLLQTSAPSWLGQVERGATTTWETWEGYKKDGRPYASHNHYAFGSVAAFLQERVAGLAPADPGYRTIRFAPLVGGGLTSASVTVQTPYGLASSSWQLDDNGDVELTVTVPPGTSGVVQLGGLEQPVEAGVHTLTGSPRALA